MPRALWEAKDFRAAAALYDAVIEAEPTCAMAYEVRGTAYAQLGKTEEATRDANRLLELDPYSAWAYSLRGTVALEAGDFDAAIADSTKALALDPKWLEAQCVSGPGVPQPKCDPAGHCRFRQGDRA